MAFCGLFSLGETEMDNAIEFKFQIDKKAPLLPVHTPDDILEITAEIQKVLEFFFGSGYVYAEATEILPEIKENGETQGNTTN